MAAGPMVADNAEGQTQRAAAPALPITDEKFVWRAIETMIWGMPAVNLELMVQASHKSVRQTRLDWSCRLG
jgi:hypothetical protein